ncbi:hypothetical protein OG579_03420 [Williamsia herbipolensis]|uniref:Uncharacterized protein n=1 Tax=Williamsia herbipolensis TaxID=1603258 RepID=A0AAU4K492_9NOCA|nr:hypothetical protein [Williamsia herbipolensis]
MASSMSGDDIAAITIPISIATGVDDAEQASYITSLIAAATDEPALLIIDLAFTDATVRGISLCDVLLSKALLEASPKVHGDSKILVLLKDLPTEAEDLLTLIDDPILGPKLVFADADFRTCGNTELIDIPLVENTLRLQFEDHLEDLRRSTLRRRGVFEYRSSTDYVSHYSFHYDPLHQVRPVLIEMLRKHFLITDCQIVLFESTFSGDWFSSCVQSACLGQTASIDSADLALGSGRPTSNAEDQRRSVAIEILQDESKRLCCLVPAFRTGGSLLNLFEQTGRQKLSNVNFMTVFVDDSKTQGKIDDGPIELSWGQQTYELEYLLPVPMRHLAAEAWEVTVARALNEVERPGGEPFAPGDDINPTRTAMLTLFDDYGAEIESPVPSGRPPITNFPQLQRLDSWDAFWLAEAAVRRAVTLRKCAREGLLVVIPDEANGSSPIADALATHCVTSVLRLPRGVIDGDLDLSEKSRALLVSNSASTVLLLDESSVTRGTLSRMQGIVEATVGRRPRTMAAIIDLGKTDAATVEGDFFSFASWQPLLVGE